MGEHQVKVGEYGKEHAKFVRLLLNDLRALKQMLDSDMIEKAPIRIGAEQEFCLIEKNQRPARQALEVLEEIDDDHFTTELGLYNLEINLDPQELGPDGFQRLEKQLNHLLEKAKNASKSNGLDVLLTGILSTIKSRHLEMDYMTPSPRYKALNDVMIALRGDNFRIFINGTDQLNMQHESVLFEACCTSFQMHLQIAPTDFVAAYNWSQAIAGPILSICTNSPLLLGKELWSETRIALFQQSIDTRQASDNMRQSEPRVTFGNDWIYDSILDIYEDDIARFKIILNKDDIEDSLELLAQKKVPKLRALSLHNGTIYRWNRACYGVGGGKPHLRIENRYIPSGPTTIDEVANIMFWVGLMKGRPEEFDDIANRMDFSEAKSNFIKAARYGKDTKLSWLGRKYTVEDFVTGTLLPWAKTGLKKIGTSQEEIDLYMNVIESRTSGMTGSEWQILNYQSLKKHVKKDEALRLIASKMIEHQEKNLPVHQWPMIESQVIEDPMSKCVSEIMSTDLFTVHESDLADLVTNIMLWKNIHHVPVENDRNELVGLLTWTKMKAYLDESAGGRTVVDIMDRNLLTTTLEESAQEAREIMRKHDIGCLPVVENNKLLGIITRNDF